MNKVRIIAYLVFSLWVVVSPMASQLYNVKVAANSDDCHVERLTDFYLNDVTLWLGKVDATFNNLDIAVRFLNLPLKSGDVVDSCWVSFYGTGAIASDTVRIRIRAERADAPATFSNLSNYDARTRTTAYTDWIVPHMTTAYQASVNCKNILQEVVDDTINYDSGDAVVLFFKNTGTDVAWRQIVSYNNNPTNAPEFFIWYTPGTGQPPAPGSKLRKLGKATLGKSVN